MGANTIGAVGVALPPPQSLFPQILGAPGPAAGGGTTNRIALAPGADFVIPAGTWAISTGAYSVLQVLDPVSNTWVNSVSPDFPGIGPSINTDGTNYRLINPLGFPVAAIVTNAGSGYTSAPTVAAGSGGSTWLAIVGGGISALNCGTAGSGVGYAVPPIISIAAPPTPGVQATAICSISGGAIATFTVTNTGAGYAPSTSVPVTVIPQSSDANFFPAGASTTAVKNAVVSAQTSFVGTVTAVLLTNEGNNPSTVPPALTFTGGAGANAAATAILPVTLVNYSVTTAGSGYTAPVAIVVVGGNILNQTSGIGAATNSPAMSTGLIAPTIANTLVAQVSGSGVSILAAANSGISFGGIYTAPPTGIVIPGPAVAAVSTIATVAVISLTAGFVTDTVFVTPL